MTIWDFQKRLSNRLFAVNAINVFLGKRLSNGSDFWSGFGAQAIGWGLINISIAVVGKFMANRRFKRLDDPLDVEIMRKDANNLRRILRINTILDLFYMVGGYGLSTRFGKHDSTVRGHGWGIVLQGALLFVFDLIHWRRVPDQ